MHKAEPHKVIFIAVEDGKGAKKTAGSSGMVKDIVLARARRKTSLTLFSIQSFELVCKGVVSGVGAGDRYRCFITWW